MADNADCEEIVNENTTRNSKQQTGGGAKDAKFRWSLNGCICLFEYKESTSKVSLTLVNRLHSAYTTDDVAWTFYSDFIFHFTYK